MIFIQNFNIYTHLIFVHSGWGEAKFLAEFPNTVSVIVNVNVNVNANENGPL